MITCVYSFFSKAKQFCIYFFDAICEDLFVAVNLSYKLKGVPRSTTMPAHGGHRVEKLITTRDFIQSCSNMAQHFCFLISVWYWCEKKIIDFLLGT